MTQIIADGSAAPRIDRKFSPLDRACACDVVVGLLRFLSICLLLSACSSVRLVPSGQTAQTSNATPSDTDPAEAVLALSNGQKVKVKIPSPPAQHAAVYWTLAAPDFAEVDAERLAQANGLVGQRSEVSVTGIQRYADASGLTRMIFVPKSGLVQWLPDLKIMQESAPQADIARQVAQDWLNSSGVLKQEQEFYPTGVIGTSRQTVQRDGSSTPEARIIQTVRFSRFISGLPVEGSDSGLAVEVAAGGVVGLSRNLRPVHATSNKVSFKSVEDVKRELKSALESVTDASHYAQINSARMIYFEQGQSLVQPAYRFAVTVKGPRNIPSSHRIVIAAAAATPESIPPFPRSVVDAPGPNSPQIPIESQAPPPPGDPVFYFGLYFDRMDYNEWIYDAWQFYLNLPASNLSGPNGVVTFQIGQFKPNYPWMWQPGNHYPDLSPNFAGRVHMAIVEGHGSNFAQVTLRDCCDEIQIQAPPMQGFGAFNGSFPVSVNAYIVWRGCLIIPSPDPADNVSQPATPWFALFKGLRGAYGFHTEMTIQDLEGPFFAEMIGSGTPILSAWLQAVTSAGSDCAEAEWNCASAILPTGNESDTLIDTDPVPSPDSLDEWWESPS